MDAVQARQGVAAGSRTQPKLPWARYLDKFGNPVIVWTSLGALLVGDDGNIFISIMNQKAYVIEVLLVHPNRVEEELASLQRPTRRGYLFTSPRERELRRYQQNRVGVLGNATLQTNDGKVRFEDIQQTLSRGTWERTNIASEELVQIPVGLDCAPRPVQLAYKAREMRRKPHRTDRIETNTAFSSQMAMPLEQRLSIKHSSLDVPFQTTWGPSPGYVTFPSLQKVNWNDEAERSRREQAKLTAKHARENHAMSRSECSWEFDAWRDVFFKIRDDSLPAMDKHKVMYSLDKDLDDQDSRGAGLSFGRHTVKATCEPDCSFGLAVDAELSDEKDPDSVLTSTGVLNTKCLENLNIHRKAGLISDPKEYSFTLAFPWAVYEAKKEKNQSVFQQIERASEIYLRILHDLALQPGRPEVAREFQTEDSNRLKIFSFTSEGPHWKIFICYRRRQADQPPGWLPEHDDTTMNDMKLIWEGNILEERRAWELHYMVDKIHQWAIGEFRDLVVSHLAVWNEYGIDLYRGEETASQHDFLFDTMGDNKRHNQLFAQFLKSQKEARGEEGPEDLMSIAKALGSTEFELPWSRKF